MRKTLVKALVGILLGIVSVPVRSPAQFLGYTSPQTISARAFNNVAVAGVSGPFQNMGQSAHILNYTTTGTITSVKICLQGSADGLTYFDISSCSLTTLTEGAIQANGYYPFVRANLYQLTGTLPRLSAWYSGTSTGISANVGPFRASEVDTITLGINHGAATISNFSTVTPHNSTAGIIILNILTAFTGVTSASGLHLDVYTSPLQTGSCGFGAGADAKVASFTITATTGYQVFRVPAVAAPQVCVRYNYAAAPTGGDYNLFYDFGPGDTVKSISQSFPVMTGPGTTAGIAVDFAGVRTHTVNLKPIATIATCTFALEGSLDSTNGVDGTWAAISAAMDCTVAANLLFHVADKPVTWIRGNLSVFTGDATASIQPYYLGVE